MARQGRAFKNREKGNRFQTRCDLQWKEHKNQGVSNGSWFKNQDCTILQQRRQEVCLTDRELNQEIVVPRRRGSGGRGGNIPRYIHCTGGRERESAT